MLLFAVLVVVAAEAAVEATRDDHFSTHLITYAAVPIGVGLVTHLVIRRVAPYADPLLLPIAVLLNGLGLVMIHRLDPALAQQAAQNGNSFHAAAPTQVLWTVIGVALFVALLVLVRDHRVLQRYAYTLALIGLVLLLLPTILRPVQRGERRADLDPGGRVLPAARRVRQDPADHLRRGLPGGQARRALAGRPADRYRHRPAASSGSICRADGTSGRYSRPG